MYGAANRSSASWVNAVGEDTTSVTAGPHFAPTAFSETRQFTAPVRGNALAIGPIFTVIFGKESKSGAFIALSGAPNPTSDMTNARATPSLNVAATWIGSNFTMDTGRGGAQTEMVIHQDGDHVGTVYWLANAADPKAVASEQSWMRGTEAFREGNFNETMRHFQSGVDLGSAASMFSLARLLDGPTVGAANSANHARANELYRQAAVAGFAPASHHLLCRSERSTSG
jgi:hypothetical protein